MSRKPRTARSSKRPAEEKKVSKPSEDYSDIPPGVRDFLGDEMHLFKRDKKAVVLGQVKPRRK